MHGQIDREDRQNRVRPRRPLTPHQYKKRRKKRFGRRRGLSTKSKYSLSPKVHRKYLSTKNLKRRYKAKDLNDNAVSSSIWIGRGKNNYLLDSKKEKGPGDIILVLVYKKFKDEITAELKRAFPDPFGKKKKKAKETAEAPAPPPAEAAGPAEGAEGEKGKPHDKISTIVTEEVNEDHLLIKGRKYLMYKQRKRTIEVQALVARRDIYDENKIDSNKIVESRIYVLR